MMTLTKTLVGAAMLVGGALAVATPAAAQSSFGFSFGNGGYGGSYYGNPGYYGDRYGSHYGNPGYRNSRGYWRWDPRLHRRVWIPYRYAYRDRWDSRWDRGYRW